MAAGWVGAPWMGQGAANISQGQGHHRIFRKAKILRKLHEHRFRYGIGTYKKSYVKAGPGHNDQHLDDGVDKKQSKQEDIQRKK